MIPCTDAAERQVVMCSSSSDTLSDLSINLQLLALEDGMECGTEGTGLWGWISSVDNNETNYRWSSQGSGLQRQAEVACEERFKWYNINMIIYDIKFNDFLVKTKKTDMLLKKCPIEGWGPTKAWKAIGCKQWYIITLIPGAVGKLKDSKKAPQSLAAGLLWISVCLVLSSVLFSTEPRVTRSLSRKTVHKS